jgi:hypothetical protein
MNLEATITDLVERGETVTLDALGSIDHIPDDTTASPLFPYVAHAFVAAWGQLDGNHRGRATALIATAIADCTSGVALNDTCLTVVPAAPDLAITLDVKDALRAKATERADQAAGGVAAIALRWLAHLAVLADEARPALTDVLTGVARAASEPMPFAVVAAQVAGLTYDCWRDSTAVDCLTRLVTTDGDADAWFALGQTRLVDALEADDRDTCVGGLRATLECFDNAANSGEQRPDARMYGHAIRFVTEWAADATADMLDGHRTEAHTALQEYMLGGRGLPDQPMWVRPRYEAETAWIELVQRMHVATDAAPDGDAWYDPAVAIGALADVYRAANSFRPRRATNVPAATAFPDLVAPTLTAPFVEQSQRVSFVERWLRDTDEPDAEAFAQLVRERSERVVSPKRRPSGPTRR